MKTKINLNFRLLHQAVVLSSFFGGVVAALLYLTHVALSAIFASQAVAFSLFGLAIALGTYVLYDANLFQWNNHPRIAIKQRAESLDGR